MDPFRLPPPHVLSVERMLDAPRAKVFRLWTTPGLLTRWWGPEGITTPYVEMELRPGGSFRTDMRAPDGQEYRMAGVFLEVTAPERIVFTNAFLPGWLPSERAWMVGHIRFEDHGDRTRYVGEAHHWTEADKVEHDTMGFHAGWGASLDRFERLVREPDL